MNGGPNAFNSYIWVIDASPKDINMVDYIKPNGEKVMRTIADYRQLNDALFHAGLNSGSQFEWEDTPNRLHFYVIDVEKNKEGILSYTLAVRSLDGSGRHERGVALDAQANQRVRQSNTPVTFTVRNTGTAAETDTALHPSDAAAYLNSDVYRLSVSVEGEGWSAQLLNGLAAVKTGGSHPVTVYVSQEGGNPSPATVILRATSESDPSKTAAASVKISR
jgi:hypothetical protein